MYLVCFTNYSSFLLSLGLLMEFLWSTWTISNASADQSISGLPAWLFLSNRLTVLLDTVFCDSWNNGFLVLKPILGIKSNPFSQKWSKDKHKQWTSSRVTGTEGSVPNTPAYLNRSCGASTGQSTRGTYTKIGRMYSSYGWSISISASDVHVYKCVLVWVWWIFIPHF